MQVLHGASHWLCVTTAGCREGEVNILDSLYNSAPPKVKRQIAILMHSPSRINVARQQGGSDCGLYAIVNAAAVCAGLDVTTLQYAPKSMRRHLMRCLEGGVIAPFPHQQVERKTAILNSEHVEVYCHCRQPERGRMIQCGQCSEWFHSKCITSVDRPQWRGKKPWFCSTCV